VVLNQSILIFQKGGGTNNKSQVCKTPIVKVDRNKYLSLRQLWIKKNPEQIRSDSTDTAPVLYTSVR